MCGIAGIFNIKSQTPELRSKALKMAQKIRHRGPDWSGIYVGGSAILAHERLSIVDPQSGGQPLYSPDRKQILAVNGEIYNHRDIRAHYAGKYTFQTGSDCEVILALYKDKGINFLEELNGIFAFALYDEETDDYLIARDPIGVIPLYIGRDKEGRIYFGGAGDIQQIADDEKIDMVVDLREESTGCAASTCGTGSKAAGLWRFSRNFRPGCGNSATVSTSSMAFSASVMPFSCAWRFTSASSAASSGLSRSAGRQVMACAPSRTFACSAALI
mgnify:CR=1 FL=1